MAGFLQANPDKATTTHGTAVTVDVLANDTLDGVPVTMTDIIAPPNVFSGPFHGSTTVNPVDGSVTYTPAAGFAGKDQCNYDISAYLDPIELYLVEGDFHTQTPGKLVHSGGTVSVLTYGSTVTVTAADAAQFYLIDGETTLLISGSALQEVTSWANLPGTVTHISFYSATHQSINLTSVPSTLPASVTNLNDAFRGASSFNHDIGGWDVSNVGNAIRLFKDATSFNVSLSSWVFNAGMTDMFAMFEGATSFNRDISGWDVSAIYVMTDMFKNASSFNQDLSSWCAIGVGGMPSGFDTGATAWVLPRPNWTGPC